jgi:hypothetical protein
MAAKVGAACSQIMLYSLAEKPFFLEKAWCSETATQQLNPQRKQRAESITGRMNEFEWNGNDQHLDGQKVCEILSDTFAVEFILFVKKQRRGATRTESRDSVDKPCDGTEQTVNNGTA